MNAKLSIPDKLGEVIQRHRRSRGIKSEEMVRLLDCSAHHYSDIENGRSKPSYNALVTIIRYLNIEPNEFFYPERERSDTKRSQLARAVETCTDEQIDFLFSVWNAFPRGNEKEKK